LDTGVGTPNVEVNFAKQVVIGNGKRFLMLSVNGGIYALKPNGEVIKLFAGTAGSIWDFELYSDAAFKDWVYCGNGVDAMQKWDGEAAATVEWKATKGSIPKGGVLCVWENRMFISFVAANVQRVYFSEFGDPEATVNEYGFVDVRGPEDDLDAVQDIAVLGARLIILKRRDIFFISSAVTMLNRRVGGPGVWSRFQVAELEDKLYFFNSQGIWSTGGTTVTMESGSINNYFPNKVNQAHLDKARVIATKDTYPRLLLAVPTGGSETNNTLIEMVPHINFRRIGGRRYLLLPAFMLHTLPASALACWNPNAQQELIVGTFTTAPISTFPVIAITDSFERANEKPLASGWLKWSFIANQGEISANTWMNSEHESGARWNTGGEVTSPATEVEFVTGTEKWLIQLLCCYSAVANSGYSLDLWNTVEGYEVILSKHVAGVQTPLESLIVTKLFPENTRWGITVAEGKVKVWRNVAGKGWELVMEKTDGTFTKGYSGINATVSSGTGGQGRVHLRNFRVAPITNVASTKISQFFSGVDDEGAEIPSHWQSSWMAIQGEEPFERIRRLNVELSGDAVLDVFSDFSELPVFSETVPKSGGEASEYRFARVRPEARGRFHSVKVRSLPGGKPFLINVMEMVVRGGKEH
jgi:hypothetical protein